MDSLYFAEMKFDDDDRLMWTNPTTTNWGRCHIGATMEVTGDEVPRGSALVADLVSLIKRGRP